MQTGWQGLRDNFKIRIFSRYRLDIPTLQCTICCYAPQLVVIITLSVLRQIHSLFHTQISKQYDVALSLQTANILFSLRPPSSSLLILPHLLISSTLISITCLKCSSYTSCDQSYEYTFIRTIRATSCFYRLFHWIPLLDTRYMLNCLCRSERIIT